MKLASTQFIPKFKTALLAGTLSIAALTATSCSNINKKQEAKQIQKQNKNLKQLKSKWHH